MYDLRFDIAPLPIAELAPIRLESTDPDEPFVLGAGTARELGNCRLALTALRRTGPDGDFVDGSTAEVHAVITPCGVVRTALIDGVSVTERVATLVEHAATVTQWSVDTDAELLLDRFHARRRVAAGQTVTVIGQAATRLAPVFVPADLAQTFRAAASLLTRAVRSGLQLETSDRTGAALAWAKARLWTHAFAWSDRIVPDITASLAAPVAGRPEQARTDLQRVSPVFFPLMAARYAAWTGDLRAVGEFRLRATEGVLQTAPAAEAPSVDAVWLAGLTEFERTAVDLGELAYAADLHALAMRARATLTAGVLSADAAAMLTALRAPVPGAPTPRWSEADDVAGHGWFTWAALEQGLLRDGFDGWRRLVAEADAPVRGAWSPVFGRTGDDPDATALFVLTLAHGLLGIQPDAPRHRIRIAHRLRAGADSLEARAIPCGDASVSLGITVEESAITLRLLQDSGAIPLTAILEPVVEGEVAASFVDGRRADLAVQQHGEGRAVPVQLVLDAERTLRIERARSG